MANTEAETVRAKLPVSLTLCLLFVSTTAVAQAQETSPQLKDLGPAGARSQLTESWGLLGFTLTNPTGQDMEARVLTFYAGAPDRQYGRDVWVPARATLKSWLCIGPPASGPDRNLVELKSLLYDRTGGQEHLLRSAEGQPLHSDLVRFSRREPETTLMLDADLIDGSQAPLSPDEEAQAQEIRDLARVFRHHWRLSSRVNVVKQRMLPPVAEALDGIDHFILGTNRLAEDVAGRRALREWLERGGSLWVLLDRVEPQTVSLLLGEELDFQVVDRISLTHIQLRNGPAYQHRAEVEATELEEPVDFVRVLTPGQQVLYTIDGWPAAFLREVGRGRILFTTLGARGWMRPRTNLDPPPAYREFPQLPVDLVPFQFLADELHPRPERAPIAAEDLRSYVMEQISYSVVSRNTILLVFGAFFLVLILAALALGRKSLLEHLGWLGPVLALGTAASFMLLGDWSRSAVPATVAVAQLVDVLPGLEEVQTSGYLAVYQPTANTASLGAEQGGQFDLDLAGLEGRVVRRVQTDLDRWHLENLEIPAGVRTASFRHTLRTRQPLEATVRFGSAGVEGHVSSGPFGPLEDVLLITPGSQALAVRVQADGSFQAGSQDELPAGQFLAGGLLSDRRRARQRLYEKLLAEPQTRYLANHALLLAWAEPVDLQFTLAAAARTTGEALLTLPVRFEPTPPGTSVTVPAAFVNCRRIATDGRALPPASESRLPSTFRLRFQVPASVLPLQVERARLTLKLHAPAREVALGLVMDDNTIPLRRLSNPLGLEKIELADPQLLRLDDQGTLSLRVEVGATRGGGVGQELWRLESASLEIRGQTPGEVRGPHDAR